MIERIDKCPDCNCDVIRHNSERFYAWHYNPVGSQTQCFCTRTYESLVEEKGDGLTCPCNEWGMPVPLEHRHPNVHHLDCDGHGKPKTQFVTGMSVAEPSLSLNRRKGDKYERLRGIIKQLEQEIEALTQV